MTSVTSAKWNHAIFWGHGGLARESAVSPACSGFAALGSGIACSYFFLLP
jgi:hypothetical protein